MRRRQLLHALQLLQPALCLARLRRLVAEAAHEVFDVCDALLLFLKAGLLIGKHFRTQALVVGVIALPGLQLLAFNAENAFAGGIDKIPVVGDHEQRAGVGLQPLLQPQRCIEVQVVGGLVQQ